MHAGQGVRVEGRGQAARVRVGSSTSTHTPFAIHACHAYINTHKKNFRSFLFVPQVMDRETVCVGQVCVSCI